MAINIPIITDFDGKGIARARKEFQQLEGAGAKASFAIKKALVPATAALGAFGGFMVHAAKGAEEARIASAGLASVLDSMGFETATDRVDAYAESLERTLAVDADVIKRTQTKLATFANLTKSVDVAGGAFDRATKAALDLAAAGFGEAENNAVQLGKALQDPIKGITALARSGVTFTKEQKNMIKAMVETDEASAAVAVGLFDTTKAYNDFIKAQLKAGATSEEIEKILSDNLTPAQYQLMKQLAATSDMAGAQNMVLEAIEEQVGGTAAATASSFDKMKYSLAGVSDTFGEMLLPVIDALAPKLAAFSKWAQENPSLMKIATAAFVAMTGAIIALNIAMALNPVSLVVAGIIAVGAALVAAYQRFEGFRNIVNAVFEGLKWYVGMAKDQFLSLVGIFKTVFNALGSAWNNTIGKLSIKIPNIPGLPGRGTEFSFPKIPALAEGGVVTQPTLALIGEAGPEAVVPLDRMNGMGGGTTVNINVQGADPQAVVDALRRYMYQNGNIPIRVAG